MAGNIDPLYIGTPQTPVISLTSGGNTGDFYVAGANGGELRNLLCTTDSATFSGDFTIEISDGTTAVLLYQDTASSVLSGTGTINLMDGTIMPERLHLGAAAKIVLTLGITGGQADFSSTICGDY